MISLRQLLKKTPKEITHREETFLLMLITETNLYFGNPEEGDDNGNTICFDLDMNLLSDNIHSSNAMLTDLEEGNYRWIRSELNDYRKELIDVPLSW
jgi:hypothetical protein